MIDIAAFKPRTVYVTYVTTSPPRPGKCGRR
jgi:hypothetical protein